MTDAVDELLAQWHRERPDLDVSPMGVLGRLTRLSNLLDRELAAFFAQYGLRFSDFDVLATLRRSGPPYELTAGALLKASMVTSGAITNRIDRMEAKGLVERVRTGEDRRSVSVRLTPPGFDLVNEVVARHVENENRILAALPGDQRDQLANTLRQLLISLGDTSLS